MANDLVRGWFTWPRLWSRDHLALWGQALDHLAPNQNASQNANLVLGSLSTELNRQSERSFKFIKCLSTNELKAKLQNLDKDMELEIERITRRYHIKRQPIVEGIDEKRKQQQNF